MVLQGKVESKSVAEIVKERRTVEENRYSENLILQSKLHAILLHVNLYPSNLFHY
jgi:hypothetical protein